MTLWMVRCDVSDERWDTSSDGLRQASTASFASRIDPQVAHNPRSDTPPENSDQPIIDRELSTAQSSAPSTAENSAGTHPTDLASAALQSAREMTRGRPGRRPSRRRRSSTGGGYSGARPDDRDPDLIGNILGRSAVALGWVAPLAEARLFSQWSNVVGADIAARCQPMALAGGELKIAAESTAWATQLRLMAPQILARICKEMPAGTVSKLIITGPSGPSWKRGPWSMRGGRGIRDTYG